MGAAKIIDLLGQDGQTDGHALEMRRQLDGGLIFRIIEPGRRAGIGIPGTAATNELARCLSYCLELTVRTQLGLYSIQREQDHVRIGYLRFEDRWLRSWRCSLACIMAALRDLNQKVA